MLYFLIINVLVKCLLVEEKIFKTFMDIIVPHFRYDESIKMIHRLVETTEPTTTTTVTPDTAATNGTTTNAPTTARMATTTKAAPTTTKASVTNLLMIEERIFKTFMDIIVPHFRYDESIKMIHRLVETTEPTTTTTVTPVTTATNGTTTNAPTTTRMATTTKAAPTTTKASVTNLLMIEERIFKTFMDIIVPHFRYDESIKMIHRLVETTEPTPTPTVKPITTATTATTTTSTTTTSTILSKTMSLASTTSSSVCTSQISVNDVNNNNVYEIYYSNYYKINTNYYNNYLTPTKKKISKWNLNLDKIQFINFDFVNRMLKDIFNVDINKNKIIQFKMYTYLIDYIYENPNLNFLVFFPDTDKNHIKNLFLNFILKSDSLNIYKRLRRIRNKKNKLLELLEVPKKILNVENIFTDDLFLNKILNYINNIDNEIDFYNFIKLVYDKTKSDDSISLYDEIIFLTSQLGLVCPVNYVLIDNVCVKYKIPLLTCDDIYQNNIYSGVYGGTINFCPEGFSYEIGRCVIRFDTISECGKGSTLILGRCISLFSPIINEKTCIDKQPGITSCLPFFYKKRLTNPGQTCGTNFYPINGYCGRLVESNPYCPINYIKIIDNNDDIKCIMDIKSDDEILCKDHYTKLCDTCDTCIKTEIQEVSNYCKKGVLDRENKKCIFFNKETVEIINADKKCPKYFDVYENFCQKVDFISPEKIKRIIDTKKITFDYEVNLIFLCEKVFEIKKKYFCLMYEEENKSFKNYFCPSGLDMIEENGETFCEFSISLEEERVEYENYCSENHYIWLTCPEGYKIINRICIPTH